jgi:ATP-dependent RNA helicase DDX1
VFNKAYDVPKYMRGHLLYPAVVLKNAEQKFNFGTTPWKFPPGNGFAGICQADVEDTSCATGGANTTVKKRTPLAIILEPSLELAQQTHEELNKFMQFLPEPRVASGLFLGGQPSQAQVNVIRAGVDIVTASPGRLMDLVQSKQLDVSNVRFFVLDEADRLLDSGNLRIVEQVYAALDKTHLQVMLFSATLHSEAVKNLSKKICKFPTWVDLKGRETVPTTVQHVQVIVRANADAKRLKCAPQFEVATDGVHSKDSQAKVKNTREWQSQQIKLLKAKYLIEVINAYKIEQAIIFIRTKVEAEALEKFLNRASLAEGGANAKLDKKYSCLQLHSGKGTGARLDNFEAFKNGEVRFLIATDVAARGVDVRELPFVINYTLPDKTEEYIHRVGRVGRAGAHGVAISLVSSCEEKVWFHSCKRDAAKSCHNTKLAGKGGCCIWYDEPNIMAAIEKRLGGEPIDVVTEDNGYKLPQFVEPSLENGGAVYAKHSDELAPYLARLGNLENELQSQYFELK